jgi:hypothetical protein
MLGTAAEAVEAFDKVGAAATAAGWVLCDSAVAVPPAIAVAVARAAVPAIPASNVAVARRTVTTAAATNVEETTAATAVVEETTAAAAPLSRLGGSFLEVRGFSKSAGAHFKTTANTVGVDRCVASGATTCSGGFIGTANCFKSAIGASGSIACGNAVRA